jgi:hypothetical protein
VMLIWCFTVVASYFLCNIFCKAPDSCLSKHTCVWVDKAYYHNDSNKIFLNKTSVCKFGSYLTGRSKFESARLVLTDLSIISA